VKENEIQDELTSIRSMMERSSKFISLSGLSGVLAGIYALIGAGVAWWLTFGSDYFDQVNYTAYNDVVDGPLHSNWQKLALTGIIVFVASIITGVYLTKRKAKQKGQNVWGRASRQLLFNLAIPLLTGAILVFVLIFRGYFSVVASTTLIFYGLALVNASNVTYNDIKYLGIIEILLGLLAALLPGYGLLFWAIGFGVLHIVYGSIMYLKYDR
jgi:general stress protein CsbA